MKVLIVDDNQDITGLLSKFLKAKGFENVVTNDPRDGLERIKEEKYDVVLLDISMPEMSGIDIIQTLEQEKILKDQKIVIYSAFWGRCGFIRRYSITPWRFCQQL